MSQKPIIIQQGNSNSCVIKKGNPEPIHVNMLVLFQGHGEQIFVLARCITMRGI